MLFSLSSGSQWKNWLDTVYSVRIRNGSLVLLGFPFFNLFICSEVQTTVSISKVSYFMWYLFIYLFIYWSLFFRPHCSLWESWISHFFKTDPKYFHFIKYVTLFCFRMMSHYCGCVSLYMFLDRMGAFPRVKCKVYN